MKICMIGSFPKPYGGVSTHCYYLTKALSDLNTEIIFLDTLPDSEKRIPPNINYNKFEKHSLLEFIYKYFTNSFKIGDILKLIKILGLRRIKSIQYAFSIYLNLLHIHQHFDIDIIHSHHAGIRSLGAYLYSNKMNIPFIMTVHGAELTLENNWLKEKRLIRYLLAHNSHIITVSNFTATYVKKRGFKGKINKIPNGINLEEFKVDQKNLNLIKKKYHVLGDRKLILFVSSFRDWKGPDVLLKSLMQIKFPYQAILIGNDLGYLDTCKKIVENLDIADKVQLLSNLPSEEIMAFYNLADIFIFPTKYPSEGFGIVALEGMATRTPVIASRIAAIPEVVQDGKTGLLFEPGNHKDLADKMNYLVSNSSLYKKLQEEGYQMALTQFNWETIAQQTLDIYQQIS